MDIFTSLPSTQQIQLSLFLMLQTFLTRRTGHGSCTTRSGIDASKWVTEPLEINATVLSEDDDGGFLIGYGLFSPATILAGLAVIALLRNEDEETD